MGRKSWPANVATRWRAYWQAQLPQPCARCGQTISEGEGFEVDHLVALSQGGEPGVENQGVSHRYCNRRHGAQLRNRRGGRGGFASWA